MRLFTRHILKNIICNNQVRHKTICRLFKHFLNLLIMKNYLFNMKLLKLPI